MRSLLSLLLSVSVITAGAQKLTVENEVVTSSAYEDSKDNRLGNGYIDKVSVTYDMPLSMRLTEDKKPVMWRAFVRGFYGHAENNGAAAVYNPDDILNATVNVMHIRPIGERWTLMATAGIGIHSTFDDFTWRDVFANAAAVFSYRHNANLDYGVGVAAITTYGWPIVLPMPYVRYHSTQTQGRPTPGTWEFDINFMGRAQLTASTWLTPRLKLNIDGLDMQSMHANVKYDGKWKVYTTTTAQSGIRPELTLGKKSTLSLAAGIVWRRTTNLADRSYAGFFKSFNHNRRRHFGRAAYITVGYSTRL